MLNTTLLLYAGIESVHMMRNQQVAADSDPAESAWQSLQAKFPRRHLPQVQSMPSDTVSTTGTNTRDAGLQESQPLATRQTHNDWQTLALESRDFIARYPSSDHVNEARKLELTAELIPLRGRGSVTPELESKIDAYLADISIPEAERYEIRAMHKEARLELRVGMRMEEVMGKRLENARELASEFPGDPRPWRTMLSTARHISMQAAAMVAGQIVNSAISPENIKRDAQRLLNKYALMERTVDSIDLTTVAGRPALVYIWTCENPQFLDLLRRCEKIEGVAFIGVNVDADEAAAREFAVSHSLPGEQYYKGPDGPAGGWYSSGYFPASLADNHGVLQEVRGYMDIRTKLYRTIADADASHSAGKGGRP